MDKSFDSYFDELFGAIQSIILALIDI